MKNETESYVGGNPFGTADNKTPLTGSANAQSLTRNCTCNSGTYCLCSSSIGGTSYVDQYHPKELNDVIVTEETIEIIYVQRAKYRYSTYTITIGGNQSNNGYQPLDRTFKEVYGSRDGRLTLLKTVEGKVTPAHTVEESFKFEE